jgi:hypothetical protein
MASYFGYLCKHHVTTKKYLPLFNLINLNHTFIPSVMLLRLSEGIISILPLPSK